MILFSLAEARELRLGVSAGFEAVTNDPFLNRNGVRVGFTAAPRRWAEVGVAAAYYPIFWGPDNVDWKPVTDQLYLENSVSVDIAKLDWQVQATARVRFLSAELVPGWTGGMGILGGAGITHTVYGVARSEEFEGYALLHPAAVGGLFWDVQSERFGVRARFERVAYIETVYDTELEMKSPTLLGLEGLCWF